MGPCLEERTNNTGTESGDGVYLGGVLRTRQALAGLVLKSSTVFTELEKSLPLVQKEKGAVPPWPPTLQAAVLAPPLGVRR